MLVSTCGDPYHGWIELAAEVSLVEFETFSRFNTFGCCTFGARMRTERVRPNFS